MVCDYTFDDKTQTVRVNCLGCIYGSSIEDSEFCMANTLQKLMEVKKVARVILAETREYEYDFQQVRMLLEIANAIQDISRRHLVSIQNISIKGCDKCVSGRYSLMQNILNELRTDPIEAYKNLLREIRHIKLRMDKAESPKCLECMESYLRKTLLSAKEILERCELIKIWESRQELKGRAIYREVFHPSIRPNFMYTRYVSLPPPNAEIIDRYEVGDSNVEILRIPGNARYIYHIVPPEFKLEEDEYTILDAARRYLAAHRPRRPELSDPEKLRETFLNISKDMISDLSSEFNIQLSLGKLNQLAQILTRYTAGLGIIELLLKDEKIQDISINSPIGQTPIYIFHADFEDCETNLIPSREDAEAWATRLRLQSGRPLDEANPVLDSEIVITGGRARVCAITKTLSPTGLAFSLRRHRDNPWTFPLFIKNRFMNPMSAGLLWFIIDNARTMLIAGTRSSGKTSLLGACMMQILPKSRIITVEDTLELPVTSMRELGYNIEQLKSRSVITKIQTELSADDALRTALRMGDSCLIVGEVRSVEARALYEAMRIGALANVVAGTIHGDSPYGVFDRVVNDLGVPATSFKATDVIVVANRLKTPDGLHSFRRLVSITEVRKHWKTDPLDEGGFVNLMEYSAHDDEVKPNQTLLIGESTVLNDIATNVREWKGSWDKVWENIMLRTKVMKALVEHSQKNPMMLEADFVLRSNQKFHIISDDVMSEIDTLDSELIYERWMDWLRKTY